MIYVTSGQAPQILKCYRKKLSLDFANIKPDNYLVGILTHLRAYLLLLTNKNVALMLGLKENWHLIFI